MLWYKSKSLTFTQCYRLDLWGLGLQGPISERLGDLVGLTRVRAAAAAVYLCCGMLPVGGMRLW